MRGVTAQSAIFTLGTGAHTYLEFDIRNGAGADAVATLASLSEPRTTIGGVNLVVGVRPSLWARLAADDAPDGVEDFDQPVDGTEGFTMPATQHDLWLWVSGAGPDVVFDAARGAISALAGCSTVASEVEAREGLAAWDQEQVMGREKESGEELDPRPEDAHNARTDQDELGKIFRRDAPYGGAFEHGTVFPSVEALLRAGGSRP